jgi:protein-tyrosine kinase
MSIIERVADLLGPTPRSDRDASSPAQDLDVPALDVVQRAVRETQHRFERAEGGEAAHQGDSDLVPPLRPSVARSTSVPTRTVRIDLERMRQQSLILPDEKRTSVAEAFRRIKRRILLNVDHPKPGTHPNLVMVTSSVPGEGKSFCAANLALSIALEMDHTVLLVDADVARPSLLRMFGVDTGKGLMDILIDRQTHLSDVLCKTDVGKLMFLPAGTAHRHATEALASGAMQGLLKEISEHDPNRVIIFDSPPLMAASEASALAGQMGQVVIVVEAGKTTEALLKSALGRIELDNVVGLLLNKGERPGLLHGYEDYGYDAT